MNFLAHFYFDSKDENPYYNLGLLFPDLLRNFIRKAKVKYDEIESTNESDDILQLVLGCRKHIQSDLIFHQWEGFEFWNTWLLERFRNTTGITIEKDWFVSHIFAELLLDQVLILRDSDLPNSLYDSLGQTDNQTIAAFIDAQGIDRSESYITGFSRFMEHRYLNKYAHTEGVIFALGRICENMGLPTFDETEERFLHECAGGLRPIMAPMVDDLEQALA